MLGKASVEEMLATEDFLADLMEQRQQEPPKSRNPSGKKDAGPCEKCGGLRPPVVDCAPWHLRQGAKRLMPRGALCQPCEWAKDSGNDRGKWPHWDVWTQLEAEMVERNEPVLIKVPPAKEPKQKKPEQKKPTTPSQREAPKQKKLRTSS